jgi:hypothetical protein
MNILHMCISKCILEYVMYVNEGKKYLCINTCENMKLKNECKTYGKFNDSKGKKRRKKVKRWKYKVSNKPVKAVGKKITKAIISLVYYLNKEPDLVRKHRYECTVCTTQYVLEYCTKVAHTPVNSGSKCKKEYVAEYIGVSLCKNYVQWKKLLAVGNNIKCNDGVKMGTMYGSAGRDKYVKKVKYKVERIQCPSEIIGMSRVRRESEEMDQDDELPPAVNQPPMPQSKPGKHARSVYSNRARRNHIMLFLTIRRSSRINPIKCALGIMLPLSLRCFSRSNYIKCALTIVVFPSASRPYMRGVPSKVYDNHARRGHITLFLTMYRSSRINPIKCARTIMMPLILCCSSRINPIKYALTKLIIPSVSRPYMYAVPNHVHNNPWSNSTLDLGKNVGTEHYMAKNWHKRYGE